jgi:hypothetical protein
MCVRLCWRPADIVSKMVDADTKRGQAVLWFYDEFGVVATHVDRGADLISIQLPWDNLTHIAEQLFENHTQQMLRSGNSDLKSEYQRYEALMYLIKSLTESQSAVLLNSNIASRKNHV